MSHPHTPSSGFVALIGAGPGAADLLTIRALRHIQRADVILHDSLSSPDALDFACSDATLIDVGKRAGAHSASQDKICSLLARHAQRGSYVVRLKGGDPFVFGRGAEELLYLTERGIACELVPGVSSCIAAPAAAHIPVTHRQLSHSFSVVTARGAGDDQTLQEHWLALAKAGGTIIWLMGLARLEAIVAALRDAGRDEDTPVAVIEAAWTPQQRVVEGPIRQIITLVAQARLKSPATVIAGDVIHVRRQWLALQEPTPITSDDPPLRSEQEYVPL
jgi:uroporphyrin-III C-methyltransferase